MGKAIVCTIGFTQSTAERFFERLIASGVRKVIDIRLHNTSQLSGFAKAADLAYLLQKTAGIAYEHETLLAPTDDLLKPLKRDNGDWSHYETQFLALMAGRQPEKRFTPDMFDGACLLCSEPTPHRCHRRLVCEYLDAQWNGALDIRHL